MSMFHPIRPSLVCATLLLVAGLTGCSEDDPEEVLPEVKDLWELAAPHTVGGVSMSEAHVHFGSDGIYLIRVWNGDVVCACESAPGQWQSFVIDTGQMVLYSDLVIREVADGSVWVLSDEFLTRISGCGASESFQVASADTMIFGLGERKFIGLEIIDGTAYLLNKTWGLYSFDPAIGVMQHRPLDGPFSFPPWEFPPFNSMAQKKFYYDGQDDLWIADTEGHVAIHHVASNTTGAYEMYTMLNLRNAPNGDFVHDRYSISTYTGSYRANDLDFDALETMPTEADPDYFNATALDRSGQLAYFSRYPYYQPYVGIRDAGGHPLTVNASDALEGLNLRVTDIAFSPSNQLYISTDQGIYRYLGRDE